MSVTARAGLLKSTGVTRNGARDAGFEEELDRKLAVQDALFEAERRRRALAEREAAEACDRCGHAFAPREPLWWDGRARYCPPCAQSGPFEHHYTATGPCASCGREVTARLYHGQQHLLCGVRCRRALENTQRKAARATAREGRSCEVCGGAVAASRRDALTCSPACRQKAYRKRAKEAREALAGKE